MAEFRIRKIFMETIILASGSPRRSDILYKAGIEHIVIVPDVNEDLDPKLKASKEVEKLALLKAKKVKEMIDDKRIILAADTIVTLLGKKLGKPKDENDAYEMISLLSGKWHKVITGFCIIIGEEVICDHEITKVKFRRLSKVEIMKYIKTDDPFDKAGGYGIQSFASVFVDKINGCYFNVMGLPISKIFNILRKYENATLKG